MQYRDANFDCTAGRRIAIELFGDIDDLDIAYRNHTVSGVRDATSPRRIRDRLQRLGQQMAGDDRLLIYATAHGGSGDDDSPHNTSIYTWNHQRFTAAELAGWLDKLPESAPVVMVMVQCYAGGFAHTIFNDADPAKGLSRQLRAGFFAQVHDRPAAGCTPDVDEESYQEYSSFFWAALAGHDRMGKPIEPVDIDGNGVTSFAEAHAYAVYKSDTVDIPLRTSDAFLAYYSTDGSTSDSPYTQARNPNEPRRLPSADLIRAQGSIPDLLAKADVIDRALVLKLLSKLQLDGQGNLGQVAQAIERAKQSHRMARRTAGRAAQAARKARDRVKREAQREWPELDADLSPMLASLMAERAAEFERKVTMMSGYRTMVRLTQEDAKASAQSLNAKKAEALALRLEHAVNRVVLNANLPYVASPKVVDRYHELLALESGSLQATSVASPATAQSSRGTRRAAEPRVR